MKKKRKKEESVEYGYKMTPEFDKYGQIIPSIHEPVVKVGEKLYRRHGKDFYFLSPPAEIGGNPKRVSLKYSAEGEAVLAYTRDLIRRGEIDLPNPDLDNIHISEGEIPFIKKAGKIYEYGGVKADLGNGKELILVDERLTPAQKMAIVYHELVHKAGYDFPSGKKPSEEEVDRLEKTTHLETIAGLRIMAKDFPKLAKNDYAGSEEMDAKLHSYERSNPKVFKEAASYAIASRGSFDIKLGDIKKRLKEREPGKRSLEKRALGYSLIILGIIVIFLKPILSITGSALAENIFIVSNWLFIIIGIGLILIGLAEAREVQEGELESAIAKELLRRGGVITKRKQLIKEVKKIEREMGYSHREVKEGYQVLNRHGAPLTVVPNSPDISVGVYRGVLKALAIGMPSFRRERYGFYSSA